jgi:hypothetical protein
MARKLKLSKVESVAGKMKAAKKVKDVVRSKGTHLGDDVVRSSPKTTHVAKKPRNYGKNLGAYLHEAKLPTGAKIGADVVKITKRKFNKMKGY